MCFAKASEAEYQNCIDCHKEQVAKWQASHHHGAMLAASEDNILADFSKTPIHFNHTTYTFNKDRQPFTVTVADAKKQSHTYTLAYTFGVFPLQQYLVETNNGKLQVLPIAWDARSKAEGGQKWFSLDADSDHNTANHRFHWQGPLLNWNGICADCHSSGLVRKYDVTDDSFSTEWDQINVSCQSCHGNAHTHIVEITANKQPLKNTSPEKINDVFISWTAEDWGEWRSSETHHTTRLVAKTTEIPVQQVKHNRQRQIQACAACHSLRTPLTDGFHVNDSYLNSFEPTLVTPPFYHLDGQIKEEVYVYGSFLQSKMHQAGVNCTDCHEPHSSKLKIEGNGVCLQCHKASTFDQPEHHRHKSNTAASQCVSCHMPATTYMKIDPRRDHSFRIPRPDLSIKLGTPNACNQCHKDETAQWSAKKIDAWFEGSDRPQHYGEVFKLIHEGHPDAVAHIKRQMSDGNLPNIIRASLLSELNRVVSTEAESLLIEHLSDSDPIVVLGALKGLSHSNPLNYKESVIPLLSAKRKSIRVEAARQLNKLIPYDKPFASHPNYKKAREELLHAGKLMAWRAEGLSNNAQILTNEGKENEAIELYRQVIHLEPFFAPAYVNLAELLRQKGKNSETQNILNLAISNLPDDSDVNHAYGLHLIRQSKHNKALHYLKRSADLNTKNAHYQYVYAVALQNLGFVKEAQNRLSQSIENHKYDAQLLSFALNLALSRSQNDLALDYAKQLLRIQPYSLELKKLIHQLKSTIE